MFSLFAGSQIICTLAARGSPAGKNMVDRIFEEYILRLYDTFLNICIYVHTFWWCDVYICVVIIYVMFF
jgi:lipoprotein signal peptidase